MTSFRGISSAAAVGLLIANSFVVLGQNSLPVEQAAQVDAIAAKVLADTGVPSASVGIIQYGKTAYLKAYGDSHLASGSAAAVKATPEMRYSVGSVSKQFTAAAILLLQQEGKLTVNDPVGKYLPELTRAKDVTIRQILSHTSGYQDYWPEDYVMQPMLKAESSQQILDTWAKKPLDFEPGTQWQYSNTNYVIAGRIVEQVSGEPIFKFLQERIFAKLGMKSVANTDIARLGDTDAQGYYRHALGPLRPAPKEGVGWMFAAGELAMPVGDLLLWDISMMNRSLLAPASYEEMFSSVKLKDGTDSHYGLGVFVPVRNGHKTIEHSGEVSGFVSENVLYPDEKLGIAVLTNEDAAGAASQIARQAAPLLMGGSAATGDTAKNEADAKQVLAGLQEGKIDRAKFTENCNAYFDQQALDDFSGSLKPLGVPVSFHQVAEQLRGGMTFHAYAVKFKTASVEITTYMMPDGKYEQFLVLPSE